MGRLRVSRVAPLYGEGRGLKPGSLHAQQPCPPVAPLYGEGRGLKQSIGRTVSGPAGVAPLYGEGRGLKQVRQVVWPGVYGRSSLWRGAWIETLPVGVTTMSISCRSSLWRGAWIETQSPTWATCSSGVAPLYGEGRGLKPCSFPFSFDVYPSLLSMERGVD